jgi:hypothetical protein
MYLIGRSHWQLDLPDGSFVDASDTHLGAAIQTGHIWKFRTQPVSRTKQKMLFPDPEHSCAK